MLRCFELAKLGERFVVPNPMVGAVLVYDNKIIGEGYHQAYGKAHAEVNCINHVSAEDVEKIKDATLYVSLEPCSHFGKTPPCADLIIQHGIKNVVVSTLDPNPMVAGNGIKKLKEAGINVAINILEKEGKDLIKAFYQFHYNKKSFITLKFAESIDGYVSKENERIKISNDISDIFVHQLRASHHAILIGKNTLDIDNPMLDVRHCNGKNPIKIILSTNGNIDLSYRIFNDKETAIYIINQTIEQQEQNIKWIKVNDVNNLDNVLDVLFQNGIQSILVEGGSKILHSFIQQNKWNSIYKIIGNITLNNGIKAPEINFNYNSKETIKKDTILNYINNTY